MNVHDKELLFLILGFLGRALAGRKIGIWEEKLFDWLVHKYIDPLVQRYIIKHERRLAIYLHRKYGHTGINALHCEEGDCAKVTPLPRREPVQYE